MNLVGIDISTQKGLQSFCDFWQRQLYLDDWLIDVLFGPEEKIPDHYGSATHNYEKGRAIIHIATQEMGDRVSRLYGQGDPYDIERTLVHELVHVRFAPFDSEWGAQKERMTNQLARSLVGLRRGEPRDKRSLGDLSADTSFGLGAFSAFWAKQLFLDDWDVEASFADAEKLKDDYGRVEHGYHEGRCKIFLSSRERGDQLARLYGVGGYSIEETLVHELLHVRTTHLKPRFENQEERTMMQLARAFVALRKGSPR